MNQDREGIFSRLRKGLEATRRLITQGFGPGEVDLEEIEEVLIASDMGVAMAQEVIEGISRKGRASGAVALGEVRSLLGHVLSGRDRSLAIEKGRLNVVLVVGVNGAGKTTSIAKMAHRLASEGYRPVLAASDTFRAAAAEQLEVWGERAGAPVIRQREGSDPAAVAFDALRFAQARGYDLVLVDTAGRLHTKVNLMEELKKIQRVTSKESGDTPQEVLLVLDATTGQNGLQQARLFLEAVGVTGILLAKMDGTAKGGIVLGIEKATGIPVKFVGVGEGLDDLVPFDPDSYLDSLLP